MKDVPEIYTQRQADFFCLQAVEEGTAAEMLNVLSDGGAVCFDPIDRRLVFATAEMLNAMVGDT